jgi:signal transduction histidine kinase
MMNPVHEGVLTEPVHALDVAGEKSSLNVADETAAQERPVPSALKNILLHTLSHELRTPFSVIQSSAELLVMLRNADRQLVSEHAKTILSEITHVTDLINRMVLFSRWEPGEQPPLAEPADMTVAAQECLGKGFLPWKDGRSAVFKVVGRPRPVRMDPSLFQLVLRNLMENAFKYSPEAPAPVVELRFTESVWSIVVRDHGIGIPREDQGRLFQPFERGSNVGNTPGMGLGLRIAHYLVNNFYGTLKLESRKGKGTKAVASFLYR